MAIKNKPVGSHAADLLLNCGHVYQEPVEAAIYLPKVGEKRYCATCKENKEVTKVGGMYWLDKSEQI